jgi:hypothetical protein
MRELELEVQYSHNQENWITAEYNEVRELSQLEIATGC